MRDGPEPIPARGARAEPTKAEVPAPRDMFEADDFFELPLETPPEEAEEPTVQAEPLPSSSGDEIRTLFYRMRNLSRYRLVKKYPIGQIAAAVFCMQARYMEHFEDYYAQIAPCKQAAPAFQWLSYEQLRTYFSFRTAFRQGELREVPTAYYTLYCYEVINDIGPRDAQEGLEQLLRLWESPCIGKNSSFFYHLRGWIVDYYILHDFPYSFAELVRSRPSLHEAFPADAPFASFAYYLQLSGYGTRWLASPFRTEQTEADIAACLASVIEALSDWLEKQGGNFDELLYLSQSSPWRPYRNAIYLLPPTWTPSRTRVSITESEYYEYRDGVWLHHNQRIPTKEGGLLLRYLIRRIEQFYRSAAHYPRKLTVRRDQVDLVALARHVEDFDGFFACIDEAIRAHYRRSQRVTVSVDPLRLDRIRDHALATQEKLLAGAEEEEEIVEAPEPEAVVAPVLPAKEAEAPDDDPWRRFAAALTPVEAQTLRLALNGAPLTQAHALARQAGTMLELLADAINEKALDAVSDTVLVLDEALYVYDDYLNQLERVIP